MKNIKRIAYIALACCIAANAQAQKTYSLDECRSMAIENNVKMRNADNSLQAAQEERKSAFTNYFPSLSASGIGFVGNHGLMKLDMAPDMSMSLLKNGIAGGVTLTQPLFAGGQIVNANRLADVGVEVGNVQREVAENEVCLTVEQYYWQVVKLQEKLKTLSAIEKQLGQLCQDVATLVNAGITTRNDLLQVQLRQNDVTSNRINLENGLALSRRVLAQYIGMGNDSINVESGIPMEQPPIFPQDLFCDHEGALRATTGYRLLESNVKASKLQQKLAVGKNMPTVAIGGSFMHDNFTDRDKPVALAFVSVSIPLSDWWGGSHTVKKQKLQVANAENLLADNSELLVIGMQQAWNDLQNAYEQIIIAHKSIEQSSENLRLNEQYYRAGTTAMSDLLDAQTLFQQSRDKYVDAYAAYRIKIVEYLQATGR